MSGELYDIARFEQEFAVPSYAFLERASSSKPVYDFWTMPGGRSSEQWIAEYASSHRHPVNRLCHTLGITLILLSLAVLVAGFFLPHLHLWPYSLALFVLGWIFQFVGHAFEHKAPEFFRDWRFLFVGVRWWWAKIRGRA